MAMGEQHSMAIHNWACVPAGTFRHFLSAWMVHLKEKLKEEVLLPGYYAQAEQHFSKRIADVLTLESGDPDPGTEWPSGSVALAAAPPKVSRKYVADEASFYRIARRTFAVRHVSRHRVVALIEIRSSANKDRAASIEEFVKKALSALSSRCHLLVIDLFPPGPHDPRGIHREIWKAFGASTYAMPGDKRLTAVSYAAAFRGIPAYWRDVLEEPIGR